MSGTLAAPEAGKFFFLKTLGPGVAGEVAGVVELPARDVAYRVEPDGNGGAKLVRHKLGEVVCQNLPAAPADATAVTENIPPLDPSQFPTNLPIPGYQQGIIRLQSLPGASAVLYLCSSRRCWARPTSFKLPPP